MVKPATSWHDFTIQVESQVAEFRLENEKVGKQENLDLRVYPKIHNGIGLVIWRSNPSGRISQFQNKRLRLLLLSFIIINSSLIILVCFLIYNFLFKLLAFLMMLWVWDSHLRETITEISSYGQDSFLFLFFFSFLFGRRGGSSSN